MPSKEELKQKIKEFEDRKILLEKKYDDAEAKVREAFQNGESQDILRKLAAESNVIWDEINPIIQTIDAEIQNAKNQLGEIIRKEFEERKIANAVHRKTVAEPPKEKEVTPVKESKQRLDKSAEKIIDSLKIQIMPSTECVEVNDAIVKSLFKLSSKKYQQALNGQSFRVKEKRKSNKKDAVYSNINLFNTEGYDDNSPLDEFDRAVLGIIISEYLSGNRYTTVNIIFRALIGNVGKAYDGIKPHKNQRQAIINSIEKLMGTLADFSQISKSLNQLHYTDKNGNKIILKKSNLLSADFLDAKINGQMMEDVIFFKANSPLFDIADAKNQIVRYPHKLLDVPNQNNTPRIISLKKYVMRRICEIKLHKQLTPTITFDDVFTKCRIINSHREIKADARNAIIKLFQHLKEQNFIKDFELVYNRSNKFVSIKFSFDTKTNDKSKSTTTKTEPDEIDVQKETSDSKASSLLMEFLKKQSPEVAEFILEKSRDVDVGIQEQGTLVDGARYIG